MTTNQTWPYPSEVGKTTHMEADVLVLGGGIAGCMAAISAARKSAAVQAAAAVTIGNLQRPIHVPG